MDGEIKVVLESLQREWTGFKSENDLRLKEIEKRGHGDLLTEGKIDKHSAAIGELQAQLDELVKKGAHKATGTDEAAERKAKELDSFRKFIRTAHASPLGWADYAKSVNVGSDPAGGWGVPETVDATILQYENDNAPMRGLCNVVTVSSEEYSQLINVGGASSGWVGETEARPETTAPTLRKITPYFGEIYANPASTQKALDDVAFSVEGWLAQEVGRQFAEEENLAFTSGNGAKKPKGILGHTLVATADATRTFDSIEKLVTASSGAFTIDKLIDLVALMKEGYRTGASMMTTGLAVAAIRKLKSGDVYVYQPSMMEGQPQRILGYPVVENDDMPVPAADANALIFGNFKRGYTIYDVKGLTVLRDPYTNKPHVMFYSTKRVGGRVTNDRCFKVLTLSA